MIFKINIEKYKHILKKPKEKSKEKSKEILICKCKINIKLKFISLVNLLTISYKRSIATIARL